MRLILHVWRQSGPNAPGKMVRYDAPSVDEHMSFLEMLDVVTEDLIHKGEEPIHFDHDCREGICGACGFMVNGVAHGIQPRTTVCQLHMRHFKDGDEVYIEPFRALAFPIVKDLVIDRSAFDRIIRSGGYISTPAGSAVDANAVLVRKENSDLAMDAAACIGCGACVAACPNASASLFTGAKISHLNLLPQGRAEASERVRGMVDAMNEEQFGNCTNIGECEAVCPKGISIENIARMNREYLSAICSERPGDGGAGGE